MFEDSQSHALAGVYKTIMLSNSEHDMGLRLANLYNAVKLVYASVFLSESRKYLESQNIKPEEEKMAVIIQKVSGSNHFGSYYYPHISGTADSFNFYASSCMSNSDGIASIALGLGKWVVEGNNSFRFCPRYPKTEILDMEELMKNLQREFYAINLKSQGESLSEDDEFMISRVDIKESLEDKTSQYFMSEWDYENEVLLENGDGIGRKVLNFYAVLKYDYYPLAEILRDLLDIGQISFGTPVQIEFAMNISESLNERKPATFHILQIRPIVMNSSICQEDLDTKQRGDLIAYCSQVMGNGKIGDIYDIIVIDPDKFRNTETEAITNELEQINAEMKKGKRKYILVGPGRWGSRDRFLGIPVRWNQIDCAKVIIEAGMDDYIIEASQGTHFMHNLLAMQSAYFTIDYKSETDFINFEKLRAYLFASYSYCLHYRREEEFTVKIDGKKGIGIIY
jgi:hypothetical protein